MSYLGSGVVDICKRFSQLLRSRELEDPADGCFYRSLSSERS
ncbi:hypothetical protein HMPREF1861_01419 [Corynebacterium kroppenstedtii]|nr:hypothetical protein HMPREF1861_01419 [Corynebacterium kroppenstedtii]